MPGETIKIIYWKDGEHWLGHLQDYPDYWTQGEDLADLEENLKDIYRDIQSGAIPGAKRMMEIELS